MSDDSPASKEHSVLDQFASKKSDRPSFFLLIAVIVVIVVFWAFSRQKTPQKQTYGRTTPMQLMPLLFPFKNYSSLLIAKTGVAKRNDLFSCKPVAKADCQNLTNSPAVSELWPAFDLTEEHVFYYSVSESGVDLYRMTLADRNAKPLTLNAGDSELHLNFIITPTLEALLSPNEEWIAFPAKDKKDNSVELFVARTGGQEVYRVTDLNEQIYDYFWINTKMIVVVSRSEDDILQYWKVLVKPNSFQKEKLNIN